MKRIATILSITVLTASSANADDINTPYCIDFENVCGGLLLSAIGNGWIVGEWRNFDCDGSTASMRGAISDGIVTVACTRQIQCPFGTVWLFNFDLTSRVFDLFGYDRVNPPFPVRLNEPFRIDQGTCPFSEGSIPATLRREQTQEKHSTIRVPATENAR